MTAIVGAGASVDDGLQVKDRTERGAAERCLALLAAAGSGRERVVCGAGATLPLGGGAIGSPLDPGCCSLCEGWPQELGGR